MLLVDLLVAAIFRIKRKGRFKVTEDGEVGFAFRTNLGSYRIDYAKNTFTAYMKPAQRLIRLENISRVQITREESWALFEEFLTGLDLMDYFQRYRDQIIWFSIKIRLNDGTDIVLYTIGEYEPHEFLQEWYFAFQATILRMFGLLPDVYAQAQDVARQIEDAIRKSGVLASLRNPGDAQQYAQGRSLRSLDS